MEPSREQLASVHGTAREWCPPSNNIAGSIWTDARRFQGGPILQGEARICRAAHQPVDHTCNGFGQPGGERVLLCACARSTAGRPWCGAHVRPWTGWTCRQRPSRRSRAAEPRCIRTVSNAVGAPSALPTWGDHRLGQLHLRKGDRILSPERAAHTDVFLRRHLWELVPGHKSMRAVSIWPL